jgi:type IX secretion system PorP/SprF family membrane protein
MKSSLHKIYCITLFTAFLNLNAQDVFFSQFYASPLTLNPALTGLSTGDLRINLNYRDQRNNLIPINTQSASVDWRMFKSSLKDNAFAFGIIYVGDEQADGLLSSLSGLASTAFHIAMGRRKNHFLAIGAQGGVFQRQLDVNALTFNNYYDDITNTKIQSPVSGLSLASETSFTLDVNAGILWYHFIEENSSVFAGLSAFHLLEPVETFLGNDEHIARRYVFHGGRRIPLNEQFSLVPNVLFMQQLSVFQVAGGTSAEYRIPDSQAAFKLGAWYRYNDNLVIGSFGFELSDFQLGVSYDILSKVQTLSRTKGGLEFSLTYSPSFRNVVSLSPNPGTSF